MSFYRYSRRHVQKQEQVRAGPSGSERLTFVWTKIKIRDLSLQNNDNNRTRREYSTTTNISPRPNRVRLTRQIPSRLGFSKHPHITTSPPYSNTIMTTIEKMTPERQHSPQRQPFTITEAQKQALIDNLQLEGMRYSYFCSNSYSNTHLHTQSPREHVNYAPSMPYKHKAFGRDSTCASTAFPCHSER